MSILKGLTIGIYIFNYELEYLQLSSQPTETQTWPREIVRSILLCRMSCFLYSILVGLVHSLSINQILPKKIWPKIYTRKMSLRNSWRHCGLMAVSIMWCFFSALWKKEFKILKQKPMSNKRKVLQKAKCFYYAIFSYMRIFLIIISI